MLITTICFLIVPFLITRVGLTKSSRKCRRLASRIQMRGISNPQTRKDATPGRRSSVYTVVTDVGAAQV